MSHINFTTLANGIKFDLSAIPGAGTTTSKFVFRPSLFHTITKVSVLDDKISYSTAENQDFNFSFDGTEFPQLKINGLAASDNYDLFNQFIALL
jgi:hypothetical protein